MRRSVTLDGSSTSGREPATTSRTDRDVIAVEPSPTMIAQRSERGGAGRARGGRSVAVPRRQLRRLARDLHGPPLARSRARARPSSPGWRGARSSSASTPASTTTSGSSTTTSRRSGQLDTEGDADAPARRSGACSTSAHVEPLLVPARLHRRFRGVLLEPAGGVRRPRRASRHLVPARCSTPTCSRRGTEQLRRDLASGEWDERLGHLRALTELDCRLPLDCRGGMNRRPLP